jgi:mannose-6-phosphate isomerase-like protein (cupin superfamily)
MSSMSSTGSAPDPSRVGQLSGVTPTRSGSSALAEVPRARGRDLSAGELEQFVTELAERPELWIHLVRHDATRRHYEELHRDAHLTAWLICWLDEHDTGFHDHDLSSGAVAVLSGALREERLVIDGSTRNRSVLAGQTFRFSASDIHRVAHAGSGPAVSLHVYSPPLLRMGAYVIGDDGVLARRPMSYAEELQPARAPGR